MRRVCGAERKSGLWKAAALVALLGVAVRGEEARDETLHLVFACRADNDLYTVLRRNGLNFPRYDSAREAVERAAAGGGVLLLADGYPKERTKVSAGVFEAARKKGVRIYVEYPSMLPGVELGEVREHKRGPYGSNIDREVIVSDAFGCALKKLRIVMVQNCHYLPVSICCGKPFGCNRPRSPASASEHPKSRRSDDARLSPPFRGRASRMKGNPPCGRVRDPGRAPAGAFRF